MVQATHQHIKLTSAEIGAIWMSYMNDSLAVCVFQYFLQHIDQTDIQQLVERALRISSSHLQQLSQIMKSDEFPIPTGFTKEDVQLAAPRAFQDTFYLMYIRQMSKVGMLAYSGFLSLMAREDLILFYKTCLTESIGLYEDSTLLSNQKGVHVRPPYMEVPRKTDYIESKSYMGSPFPVFGKQRPLNAIEISHLFTNIETNLLGSMLSTLFAQMTTSKEVANYMVRGKEMAQKHLQIFARNLIDSNVQSPMSWDTSVTATTTPAFSDKLMMYHMSFLSAAGIGNYGTAAAASLRADVAADYVRLSAEIAQYAKDGADLMIKNQWMEEPPQTPDREALMNMNKH
jgi:hypothetical protein